MKRNLFILSLLVVLALFATACGSAATTTQHLPSVTDAPAAATEAPVATEAPAAVLSF